MPSIRRATLDGRAFDTGAYRDRVLIVKFFAKYCAPCQKTLPATEALHRKRPDVVVIGISEDENTADARDQVRQHGLSFPVIQDAGNVLAGRFRVSEMPITFVGDYAGRVAWVGGPDQTEEALAQAIEALRR
jgi:thiol-disulfide isomerase/thioredoxin